MVPVEVTFRQANFDAVMQVHQASASKHDGAEFLENETIAWLLIYLAVIY